jgi:DNA modification methylase
MNQLFYGDNLEVLRTKVKDEFVDLCYIDPPFNSKRNYNQIYNNVGSEDKAQAQAFVDTWTWNEFSNEGYDDIMNNPVYTKQTKLLIDGLLRVLGKGSLMSYLISMTQRINEIHRVLKTTGSFYLHCDSSASHYLKLICDSVFCSRKGEYRNEIIWAYDTGATPKGNKFLRKHDVIFWYTKSINDVKIRELMKKHIVPPIDLKRYKKDPDGRLWRDNPVGDYSEDSIAEMEKEGLIYYTKNGKPRVKMYLQYENGEYFKYKKIPDFWDDIDALNANAAERLGYPTQKPETLLERILRANTDENDVILDAFCGCGTTVAVAQRMNRQWIGIDITYQSISLIMKRLEDSYGKDILKSITLSGIPEDIESAIALANKADDRIRKEFEKWIVLTYSNNRAMINEKKGGDGGIDGEALILELSESGDREYKPLIFSVKSNKTLSPTVIRDLYGTVEREKAAAGVFLTLYPMPNLVKEAAKYGTYENSFLKLKFPKIQVVSVEEILAGARLTLPATQAIEVTKKAKKVEKDEKGLFD